MPPPIEISIPTTSLHTPADNSKPYTLYNITLRLPLRTYVLQRRYSEFVILHQHLASTVGSAPPAPIPGKSWFKSTVSSPELTEDRRRGLEAYLRSIAEPPDRRWRDTPVYRQFLNLPVRSAENSLASDSRPAGAGYGVPNRDAANRAAAQDPGTWLDLHKEMKGELQEARRCLARRDGAAENATALEAGAAAKGALVKTGGLLSMLADGLRVIQEMKRLGDGEIRRRKDLLAAARVEREDLDKLSSSISATARFSTGTGVSGGVPSAADKAALIGSGPAPTRAKGRVLGAPLPETDRTRELDNTGVLQLQQQLMKEQDQDVESLTKIVRRQREMAMEINREVEEQTEMLDALNADADRLGSKVEIAKRRTKGLS